MKRAFKRIATISLSTALIMSNSLAVLAADNEREGSGSAAYEGYVDETSAFTVVVPTAASTDQFNFTVDPNGLLAGTDYARLLSDDVTAANFDTAANLYFKNTHKVEDEDVLWYTNSSKPIVMENKSSYDVNVEVAAEITGATGITLASAAPTATTGDPTLYLAIVTDDADTDKQTIAITSEGGVYDSEIAGVPDNFMIRYTDEKYQYVERTNTDPEKKYNKNGDEVDDGTAGVALDDWETISFYLTGKCGGEWTADQSELTIGVSLTWKVTDPEAVPANAAPSIASTATFTIGQQLTIPANLGSGELGATAISSVKASTTSNGTFNTSDKVTVSGNNVVVSSAAWATAAGSKRYIQVVFNDEAHTTVVIEVSITE
ncbi:MAG: hypothetical protein J5476_07275 [Lachnospiraceae bacterium]|nr:hypothetical protein [Lachnospiraceae bacterium]